MTTVWNELRYGVATYPMLYLLWGIALASWFLAVGRFLSALRHRRPVRRSERALQRLWQTVYDSTLQVSIWRSPLAGLMHIALFWGGGLLLAVFVASHYLAPRGELWQQATWVHSVSDLGLLLALAGLTIAAWRRLLRRELPAETEDVALCGLLTSCVAIAILSNALLVAIAQPDWRAHAWLSNSLARLLAGLPVVALRALYGWSWTVLHGLVWACALMLPWVKWRHAFLVPFSLFSKRRAPIGRMDSLNLTGAGPYGARRPVDLTWKEGVDLASCTRCGRCENACPAHLAGRALSPLAIMEGLRYAAGTQPLSEQLNESMLWDCTTCMACEDVCPVGISPLSMVLDLRRERVLDAAVFPESLQRLFRAVEQRGNPWGLPRERRTQQVASLGLPTLQEGGNCEALLWLSCMGAYDERSGKSVVALVRLLQSANVSLATLGIDEDCCGDPARRAGNEHLWRELALRNVEKLRLRHFERLISLCPHCVNTLSNEYRDLGFQLPAVHATTYLAELLASGRLPLDSNPLSETPTRLAFHDPCYLGRGNGLCRPSRTLLAALPGVEFVELKRHGRDALCCGAGGAQMWMESDGKSPLDTARVGEVSRSESAVCATACPYCASMLADGLAGANSPIEVRDVVELLAEHLR